MTAVPDMDPRVAALMAKLQQSEEKEKKKEEPITKPPTNLEEFMKVEKLVSVVFEQFYIVLFQQCKRDLTLAVGNKAFL